MFFCYNEVGENMLKIDNYSMSYVKGSPVVQDLSLEVKDGDVFAFVGHNGAGKTTTIKSIAGINYFEEGNITLDGVSIKDNPIEFKQNIAYIPDSPDLYDYLTGIQYLNFIANMYQVSEKDRELAILKYSKLFDIKDNLGDLIASYSHGMKQKLAVISALVHDPKLYILDEPFVGLDPYAAHNLKEIMKEKCKEGKIIFFSTHVLDTAEKICNKIAIIKKGKLIVTGDMKSIIKNQSLEDIFLELVEHD